MTIAKSIISKTCRCPGGVLLLLEHPPVYTVGIRTKGYTAQDEERLKMLGADFHKINRGGLITFHGPGQLVVYPIINLKMWKPSVRWYVEQLEETVINVCSNLSVKANRLKPHPGIWVQENKICAIGVHVSRYVTTHGLAFNCNVDLNWFNHIVPCGIEKKGVTSLSKELEKDVQIESVVPVFLDQFKKQFNCNFIYVNEEEFDQPLYQTENC